MKKILVYNVGVSDIKFIALKRYKEEIIFRPDNLYELTKKIYSSELSQSKEGLNCNFIIKKKFLNISTREARIIEARFEILNSFLKFKNFDKVVLIGTNQRPNDNRDTIYTARLMSKYLKRNNIDNEVIQLKENPTDLPELIKKYSDILNRFKKNHLFFNITTGTPIQSLTLVILSPKFGAKLLYKPMKGKVQEIKIPNE